jgi:hypothetical protein
MGGHLEIVAVFEDERVSLLRESGPGDDMDVLYDVRADDDP